MTIRISGIKTEMNVYDFGESKREMYRERHVLRVGDDVVCDPNR